MADTIAAVATGTGASAIGIVRLSGSNAISLADSIFYPKNGEKISSAPDRKLIFGEIHDLSGKILDIALCTVSHAPNTYTGEDTAELQCHGGQLLLSEILETLFAAGARQALPGEFTKRAFLNGRLDLTQSEAVIDLIEAETSDAVRNAAGQLGGALKKRIGAIYDSLVDMMSHFHAVLDYPDEDIEDFELKNYEKTLLSASDELKNLLSTFERGKVIRDGIQCAIIGKPNVGKSSLLNALAGYDRAIVTDVAGTTRDTIEEKVQLGKVLLRLVDTAGIHDTTDNIEKIGISRACDAAENAALILAVFDSSENLSAEDEQIAKLALEAEHSIAVFSKADLPSKADREKMSAFKNICYLSSVTGAGFDDLRDIVSSMFQYGPSPSGEILTNERQANAVARALDGISKGYSALKQGITPDAVLTEIEDSLSSLGEITGKTIRDDITSRIFERFCVGK